MRLNISVFLFFCFVMLTACKKESRGDLLQSIQSLEKELAAQTGEMDKAKANDLITLQTQFATTFPKDSAAVKMYFNAAGVAHGIRNFKKSVELLDDFIKANPTHSLVPMALLTQGMTLEQDLGKQDAAREKYQTIIRQYPNTEFANQSRQLIGILGVDPAELVRQFEAKRDSTN